MKKVLLCILYMLSSLCSIAQFSRSNTKKSVPYRSNYQRVASGCNANHTLEIREGTLWGWGSNNFGEVGDGTTINRNSPIQIGSDNNWVSVATGFEYSLGIKADGTLWGWGTNNYGQLGNGQLSTYNSNPIQIGTDNNWISVSAGAFHTIGLKADGTIWAWGRNNFGQLGDGTTTDRITPTQVGTNNNWIAISAGGQHCLGLKSNGTLWAWGWNYYGELGNGNNSNQLNPVKVGSDNKWVMISGGELYSIALKSDGTLWAWGDNRHGQLGNGTTANKNIPIQIGTDNTWTYISAGGAYSSAMKVNGTIWTWGRNVKGQIGNGTNTSQLTPLKIGTDNNWVSIVASGEHSIALKSDGTLWAWGDNGYGQLGDGTNIQRKTPIQTSAPLSIWLTVKGGRYHSIGLKSDGTIWTWGYNGFGQLGDGTNIEKHNPLQLGSDNNWISVEAGPYHCLAIKADGTLWGWGQNENAQLGDGTIINRNTPIQIGIDNEWVSISTFGRHNLALKADGTLWAWGYNNIGQIGDGTTIQRNIPIQIGSENNWVSVSGGKEYSFALKSNGTLWGWGENKNGELGDGTDINRNLPVQVGNNGWIGISAGMFHSLALKSDGTLWGWGNNYHGQINAGSVYNFTPNQIGTENNWISYCAGWAWNLCVKSNGTLWVRGANWSGALGDGTDTTRKNPVQIGSENNWLCYEAGDLHSIALKANRKEFCATGSNYFGELGDGTRIEKNTLTCNTNCPRSWSSTSTSSICSGDNAIISLNGNSNLYWYDQDSAGIYLGSGTNYITPILNTTTTYYVEDSLCTYRLPVTVIVKLKPYVIANSSAYEICANDKIILTGSGANTYSWTNGVKNGENFIPTTTANYTVTGTDLNGCFKTASTMVIVNPLPEIITTSSANEICSGTSVRLTASGASSYSWTNGITNDTEFIPLTTKTYTVTGIDTMGCKNTASVNVKVHALPDSTTSVCGSRITANQKNGSYQWFDYNNGNMVAVTGAVNQTYIPKIDGEYSVKVTTNGCSSTSSPVKLANVIINDDKILPDVLTIYPNPSFGEFNFRYYSCDSEVSNYTVLIYDVLGQVIFQRSYNSNIINETINLTTHSHGIYFLEITGNNLREVGKIILE